MKTILEKYKGLRKEDLHEMNPSYSCVICANTNCPYVGQPGKCCPDHQNISVRDFVKRYDFSP